MQSFVTDCIEWAQIENITVDLPSDITILPQYYTLHTIKIGYTSYSSLHAANWYNVIGNTSTELCNGYRDTYSCTIGNGMRVDYGNGRWDFTLTLTWSGENGASNNNGDLLYRFYLYFGFLSFDPVMRNLYISVTSEYNYKIFF